MRHAPARVIVLRDLFGRRGGVPSWADVLDGSGYRLFKATVSAELERLGVRHAWDEGFVRTVTDDGQHDVEIGMTNLVRVLAHAPRESWRAIVREHLAGLADQGGFQGLEGTPDREAAEPSLRLRVYGDELFSPMDLSVLAHRRLATGIIAVIVRDLSRTIRTVQLDEAAAWGRTADELWPIALEQTTSLPVERTILPLEGRPALKVLTGPHLFVTGQLLTLGRHMSPVPEAGALVAVPNRQQLLFKPLGAIEDATVLGKMVDLARRAFAEGFGPISPFVYWWRLDELVPLARLQRDRAVTDLPRPFRAAIDRLPRTGR